MPRKRVDLSTGEKRCAKCATTKPLDQFFKSKNTVHGYGVYCKTCSTARHNEWRKENVKYTRAASKKWRDAHPRLAKDNILRRRYGMPLGAYATMLTAQNGKCAICQTPQEEAEGRGDLHVDHCSQSGRIRGLLCHGCNVSLGHFKHNPDILHSAISYLAKGGAEIRSGLDAHEERLILDE